MSLLQQFNQISAEQGFTTSTQFTLAITFIERQGLGDAFLSAAQKDVAAETEAAMPVNLQHALNDWVNDYADDPDVAEQLYLVEVGLFDKEDPGTAFDSVWALSISPSTSNALLLAEEVVSDGLTERNTFCQALSAEAIVMAEHYYQDDNDVWRSLP